MSWKDIYDHHHDVLRQFVGGTPLNVTEISRVYGNSMESSKAREHLKGFLRNGVDLEVLSEYGIRLSCHYDIDGIVTDGTYQFILTSRDKPITLISFNIVAIGLILINQLQSLVNRKHGRYVWLEKLTAIKWEKALIMLVCAWGSENGFGRVMVQPAEENRYYYAGLHYTEYQERFHLRYDVTARRCGFRKLTEDPYKGYHYKDL